jgi:mycobactin phenyloxazoline synthetase
VREAAVAAPAAGAGGERRLVACVVPAAPDAGDRAALTEALAAELRRRLPEPMMPAAWVLLDALPLTANGKVDRRAIVARLAAGRTELEGIAPRTPLEAAIAHLWTEALEAPAQIGVEDDYFLLGGDSVVATVLVGRLREGLATDAVSVRDILTARTVAGLAQRLSEREDAPERLAEAAEVYLEIARMSDDEVEAQLRDRELPEMSR